MIKLRIKEVCSEKSISQKELAQRIGISTTSLSRISSGEQNPSFDTLEKIATALDVEAWQLLTRSRESNDFMAIVKDGSRYYHALSLADLDSIVGELKEKSLQENPAAMPPGDAPTAENR